ncbi:MAG: amino-acid N-acetyltransferase [Spirochaetales bacterium]
MNYEKTQSIRNVLHYVRRFKQKSAVIHIDDAVIDSPLFLSHIQDICLIHQAGIQIVIVPGAKQTINTLLEKNSITWKEENGFRITDEHAIPLIKTAAFDTANRIMTSLAGNGHTALIGNWVKARGKGIIDGVDYGTCGEITKLESESIQSVLKNGFIPIFPCIGWSAVGKPYNISSADLACELAIRLQAEKLFYVAPNIKIHSDIFFTPQDAQIGEEKNICAMSIEQAQCFIDENKEKAFPETENILKLTNLCVHACNNGVVRSHIVNGCENGAILCEIFSDLGTGTMIYKSKYAGIRPMTQDDIPSVLNLMQPFVEQSIILPRNEQNLSEQCDDYIVYEIDASIKACAALHFYDEDFCQAEVAALVVDESCSCMGIGPKLIAYLTERAKQKQALSVFVLTTQSADWFESQGFKSDDIQSLPEKRKKRWNKKRSSKLFRLHL